MHRGIIRAAVAAMIGLLLAGCASNNTGGLEYKKAVALPPLEVPPDLTAPDTQGSDVPLPEGATGQGSTATGTTAAAAQQVLLQPQDVKVMRDGTMRWLVVQATPERLWPRLQAFFRQQGLKIAQTDPASGVMETQWAENLADVPQDFLSRMVGKVFKGAQSASVRDMYRVRLARGSEAGTTEIYLTQYKIGEVILSTTDGFNQTRWQRVPSDPEQVNVMLNRMLVFLGEPAKQAQAQVAQAVQPPARARLETGTDGVPAVVVDEDFAHTWRRVGIALDKMALVVDSQDPDKGVYVTHQVDLAANAGAAAGDTFSSLFTAKGISNQPPQTRIVVQANGTTTRITVQDASGQPLQSDQAKAILTKLTAELR